MPSGTSDVCTEFGCWAVLHKVIHWVCGPFLQSADSCYSYEEEVRTDSVRTSRYQAPPTSPPSGPTSSSTNGQGASSGDLENVQLINKGESSSGLPGHRSGVLRRLYGLPDKDSELKGRTTPTLSDSAKDGEGALDEEKLKQQIASSLSLAEDEDICPTCLDPYTTENPKIMTQCRHHFHLACIYEWMERSKTCPMCGREMVFDELDEA